MRVRQSAAPIGAEIFDIDLAKGLDEAAFNAATDALHQNEVIVFRGLKLSAKQQIAFSKRLGDLDVNVRSEFNKDGHPEVLILSNNQAIPDPAARKGIFDHAEAGKGIVIVHAGAWYNWADWKEYNRQLVGGGSRGHEKLQDFEVLAVDGAHPVMAGVPASFKVKDELYFYQKDAQGPDVEVLAKGKSLETGKEWPVVLRVKHPKARIIVITLGHDGAAHELPAYQTLLKNAVAWVKGK